MKAFYLSLCFLFLLIGCQPQENTTNQNDVSPTNQNASENNHEDLSRFFKPDKSIAKFIGDGNEFATYTEKTTWLDKEYVGTIVDNGGVTMMNIYKIGDDKIEIIYKEPVDHDATFPGLEEIKSMQPIETYFAMPIQVGTTFGNWKIVDTGISIEIPYKTFEEVIVIEENGDNYVNRKYFAEGFGEIKSEYIMNTDQGEKYIVTSTLESITID